jgi:putative hydrolase of HD superfamily
MTEANPFERLERQIQFILEIDKLKEVFRRSYIVDCSRHENSAEHSWYLAVLAILLWEHAKNPSIDLLRILKMVVVHDIVEVDAGDTFIYDEDGASEKSARESAASERIFALLPADQEINVRALWEEFESGLTREAKFANAIDRLEPILLNYFTQGKSWLEHGITAKQAREKNLPVLEASAPLLAEYAAKLIDDAEWRGFLATE